MYMYIFLQEHSFKENKLNYRVLAATVHLQLLPNSSIYKPSDMHESKQAIYKYTQGASKTM